MKGYNDNSGLGPILSKYLAHNSTRGQILVLIINEMGDHQMRMYFNATENPGGMICEDEAGTDKDVFRKMRDIHQKSFEDVNGTFIEREGEKTCAIRLAHTAFFQVLL